MKFEEEDYWTINLNGLEYWAYEYVNLEKLTDQELIDAIVVYRTARKKLETVVDNLSEKYSDNA